MRNIIITGGELFNKGAQAMVFITVDELKKRYPDHKIYLLSEMDLKRSKAERDNYSFDFMGWYPIKFARAQSRFFLRQICKCKNSKEYKDALNIYSNCDLMVDISGYALSSYMPNRICNNYLDHIEFAKSFNIPLYIMPQSFGPFDFKKDSLSLKERIASLLTYPSKICVREKKGYYLLKSNFSLNNLEFKNDLVLNNKELDVTHIYKYVPDFTEIVVNEKSVCIVPNKMTYRFVDEKCILDLYREIIIYLLSQKRSVYIVNHSEQDAEICEKIKSIFESESKVIYINKDLNCIEFNRLVNKFEFIIASRFHSIVHAYKNGIPCIVLGWADKYIELLKLFNQDKYLIDLRNNFNIKEIFTIVSEMQNNYGIEKETICICLNEFQRENIFDILPDKI